ncbi:methylamine utilization protein MauE [Nonomuraea sp. MG754425]|uniref:MauE/DoxX family redox-associated membrane protein n=1 Tax=Nonomuraea sp. MG754425 TaxID=2570319 RepID=UPI001F303899|nr:MauE/DoxX family redox-associated membrane protein [Nonomuraea sp. MG754425]MCF6470443.1 methylamine utilization protein MauE [Nonomuraea sp. MG754425]
MSHVLVATQVLLTTVFAVSAYSKLRSGAALRAFAATLSLLPRRTRRPAAMAVVAAEVVTVGTLLPLPGVGLAVSGLLLVAFCAWIVLSLHRGQREPCRCFGASATPLGPAHLVRNGLLLLVAALGGVALTAGGPVSVAGIAVAGSAGLVGAILLIVFDDIADLFMAASGSS